MNNIQASISGWIEQQGLVRKLNRHSLVIAYGRHYIFIPREDHIIILPCHDSVESSGLHFLNLYEIEQFFSDTIIRLHYANPEFFSILISYIDEIDMQAT